MQSNLTSSRLKQDEPRFEMFRPPVDPASGHHALATAGSTVLGLRLLVAAADRGPEDVAQRSTRVG
jgi:hypothetical protein